MMMQDMRWKAVPAHPMYEVSDVGCVRSWKSTRGLGRGNGTVTFRSAEPKILKIQKQKYLVVHMDQKPVLIHRAVLAAFSGPPNGRQCRHLNGNPHDNRLSNLKWGTAKDNADDRAAHGTLARGMRSNHSALTDDDVIRIRGGGERTQALVEELGVSATTIGRIRSGIGWAHIECEFRPSPPTVNQKLSPGQVRSVRDDQRLYKIIAAELGVSIQTICDIKKRRSRKDVL